jgi:hypothetical protein
MLAKIVQHNLWPVVRRSDLILKRAQFVYAIHLRLPFCLCKHILGVILEARDESNTGLPFGYLFTQIILQSGISIAGEPKMKIQDPLSKQTLMKSNAQLRRDDPDDDDVPPPPPIPVGIPSVASSSQTAPPPQQDVSFLRLWRLWQLSRGAWVPCSCLCHPCSSPSLPCNRRFTPSTSGYSRTSWTSGSASSSTILPAVTMRMMR